MNPRPKAQDRRPAGAENSIRSRISHGARTLLACAGLAAMLCIACSSGPPEVVPDNWVWPTETPEPTFTPNPSPTPILPTKIPQAVILSAAEDYGICQGVYTGEERRKRKEYIRLTMEAGAFTPAQVLQMTLEECNQPPTPIPTQAPSLLGTERSQTTGEDNPTQGPVIRYEITPTPTPPARDTLYTIESLPNGEDLALMPNIAAKILGKEWVSDGMTRTEAFTVMQLIEFAKLRPELASLLTDMPLLDQGSHQVQGAITAVQSNTMIDRDYLLKVMEQPAVANGIGGTHALPITLSYGDRYAGKPAGLEGLFQEDRVVVTSQLGDLEYTGNVLITVVTVQEPPAEGIFNTALSALRRMDQYLRQPMRTTNVVIEYREGGPVEGSQASYYHTYVSLIPKYNTDGEESKKRLRSTLSQYWFNGHEQWFDLGIAEVLAGMTGTALEISENIPRTPECTIASKIQDLQTVRESGISEEPWCEAALGERFFRTIIEIIGQDLFQAGVVQMNAESNSGAGALQLLDRSFGNMAPEALAAAKISLGVP